MPSEAEIEAAIRADLWGADIHAIVDAVNEASDAGDMSTEQCVALGVLLERGRLSAASAVRSEGVKVRDLEWVWSEFHSTWYADSVFGDKSYRAWEISGTACVIRPGDVAGVIVGKTIEDAKSAAQEHYTNAVLSAITSPVETREDGIREAAGTLVQQLKTIQASAERDGEVVYHKRSPMAETIATLEALLSQPEPKGDKT
jgi:hypothetical protein